MSVEEEDVQFLTDLALSDSGRLQVHTKLLVLQHPGELKRNIRTCRMLELGLAPDCVTVRTARKFPGKDEDLAKVLEDPGTRLLYPGPGSEPLTELEPSSVQTLVLLDGTWDQARKLFSHNPALQRLGRVSLSVNRKEYNVITEALSPSQYVVRTQPNSDCLSTLEAGVHSLAVLERRPEIVDALLAPLVAMCNFQINQGAVKHDSKDFKQQHSVFRQENKDYQKRKPQFRR